MLGTQHPGIAGRPPEHDRYTELSTGHRHYFSGPVNDLVDGDQGEVECHKLHDGTNPIHGRSHTYACEAQLGYRCIDYAFRTKFIEHALAHFICAIVFGYFFPNQKHFGVSSHFFVQGLTQGFSKLNFSHTRVWKERKNRPLNRMKEVIFTINYATGIPLGQKSAVLHRTSR